MTKKVKSLLNIFLLILISIAILVVVFLMTPFSQDNGTFLKMRSVMISHLGRYNAEEKEINSYFSGYTLKLNPLYALMFKTTSLNLFLKSYQGDKIDTATINQLEIGTQSSNFFDFTFMIRPSKEYSVPFLHGDALKTLPGVKGALYMDFYSLRPDIDVDAFFGPRIEKIREARNLVVRYFKEEGFGELTRHLDQYKSPYRLEILEPKSGSAEETQEYFDAAYKCFRLYVEAYLESLALAIEESDEMAVIENQKGIEEFVNILYEQDSAVKMGKKIFPEKDFDRYFLSGFWGVK